MLREYSKELVPDEDRMIEIGGETFVVKYPNWKDTSEIWNHVAEEATSTDENGNFNWVADAQVAIDRIPLFLEPVDDAHARFRALVERKENAVPRFQIIDLYKFLLNWTSGFPTTPPSPSENGAGGSDTSSADVSPSQEETPTA